MAILRLLHRADDVYFRPSPGILVWDLHRLLRFWDQTNW
jgi:hypothetical protein